MLTETKFIAARVPTPLATEFQRLCAAKDSPVSRELRRLIREDVEAKCANGGPTAAAAGGGSLGWGTSGSSTFDGPGNSTGSEAQGVVGKWGMTAACKPDGSVCKVEGFACRVVDIGYTELDCNAGEQRIVGKLAPY